MEYGQHSGKMQILPQYTEKGPKTDKKNFRPISIPSTLSKICAAIIHDRLIGHLSENNIISEKQGDSETNQLLYLNHKIRLAWTKGLVSHTVFCFISVQPLTVYGTTASI